MLGREGGRRGGARTPARRLYQRSPDGVDDARAEALRVDAERIRRAAAGDVSAVAELYAEHRPVALRVAARLCRPADVDDVVADAFVRVFDQVRRGGGPRTSFRAYLLTAVRHAATDLVRAEARLSELPITDDLPARHAPTAPREDAGSDRQVESHVLADALATLPDRWQLVVWWSDVENRPMSEIGARLGLTANAAAALAFRAREGLRQAYLAQYVERADRARCRPWRGQLPALVRDKLSARAAHRVTAHVDTCDSCAAVVRRLHDLLAQPVG